MDKNYVLTTFLALIFLISQQGFSQEINSPASSIQTIEGLSIFPNPVENGKQLIHITSKRSITKNIEVYNVLGKQIFSMVLIGKELNISKLTSGVYVLKITEGAVSETRKLVIK